MPKDREADEYREQSREFKKNPKTKKSRDYLKQLSFSCSGTSGIHLGSYREKEFLLFLSCLMMDFSVFDLSDEKLLNQLLIHGLRCNLITAV